jgi:hypothetical protein
MTPDEINIAIAEFCGFKDVHFSPSWNKVIGTKHEPEGNEYEVIPNYYGSLDAVHEAEKHAPKRKEYAYMLYRVVSGLASDIYVHWSDIGEDIFDATAPQRCEALLKTIERWRD